MKERINNLSGASAVTSGDEFLLRKWDVAERLNVSQRTVDRIVASGLLPKLKVRGCVCFRPSDVSAVSSINLQPLQS
jgi:excisionase family DNA binding protein